MSKCKSDEKGIKTDEKGMQGEVAQTMYKHMSKCKSDKNFLKK
jgi:hypothetical protein